MQTEIHSDLQETEVTCGCGESFTIFTPETDLIVEICSNCHPFYTGEQKLVDTEGRVEKFQDKYDWSEERASEIAGTEVEGVEEEESEEETAGKEAGDETEQTEETDEEEATEQNAEADEEPEETEEEQT